MSPKPDEEIVDQDIEPDIYQDQGQEHIQDEDGEEEEEECLLTKAEHHYEMDQLSKAAKILRSLDASTLQEKHHAMLKRIKESEDLVKDMKSNANSESDSDSDADAGWIDNGISKGKFPTRVLYRMEHSSDEIPVIELRAKCETPISKDLLEPLLSVLNETQLYETWLPSFSVPKLQIRECKKLKQSGRVSQIIYLVMDIPWPMAARELILHAAAFDNIDEDGQLGIKLKTIQTGDDEVVPEPDPKTVRLGVDGGFLFEKCPTNHPCMEFVPDDEDKEDMILVSFSALVNPNMKYLPQSFLNFLVKVAFATAWKVLLKIATDVQHGKRPDHTEAISSKVELYDYVRERLVAMLSAMTNAAGIIASSS